MFLPLLVDSSHNPSHPRRFHLSDWTLPPRASAARYSVQKDMEQKKKLEKTRLNSAKIGSFF